MGGTERDAIIKVEPRSVSRSTENVMCREVIRSSAVTAFSVPFSDLLRPLLVVIADMDFVKPFHFDITPIDASTRARIIAATVVSPLFASALSHFICLGSRRIMKIFLAMR